jgi:FHA domain
MSVTCPEGHESETTDYCDRCGAPIGAPTAATLADPSLDAPDVDSERVDTDRIPERPAPAEAERCPRCQTPRTGDDRFCEVDGYDFLLGGQEPRLVRWELEVTADRAYYDSMESDGVAFPTDFVARRFELDGDELLIGRRSASRGIEPQIDLAGAPEDEGISHRHAVLARAPDGSYSITDCGSTNGTSLNDDADAIAPGDAVPLVDGDRVHIGAWTTIAIHAVRA